VPSVKPAPQFLQQVRCLLAERRVGLPVLDRDVLLRLENNVRLRLAQREDWAGSARSLERMLVIAPDRPELLFEAGQLNAHLDKRRAAIAAFERFLDLQGEEGDPDLRRRASALLQELRRGLN